MIISNKVSYPGSRLLFSWDLRTNLNTCCRFSPSSKFLARVICLLIDPAWDSGIRNVHLFFVCSNKKKQAVAGEGDRKSNEALDWRYLKTSRDIESSHRGEKSHHQRRRPNFGHFNLKISLHWSVQISHPILRSLHPTTIYSHRFSHHPYYTHCDLEKPVGRHFSNSLKLGPT